MLPQLPKRVPIVAFASIMGAPKPAFSTVCNAYPCFASVMISIEWALFQNCKGPSLAFWVHPSAFHFSNCGPVSLSILPWIEIGMAFLRMLPFRCRLGCCQVFYLLPRYCDHLIRCIQDLSKAVRSIIGIAAFPGSCSVNFPDPSGVVGGGIHFDFIV